MGPISGKRGSLWSTTRPTFDLESGTLPLPRLHTRRSTQSDESWPGRAGTEKPARSDPPLWTSEAPESFCLHLITRLGLFLPPHSLITSIQTHGTMRSFRTSSRWTACSSPVALELCLCPRPTPPANINHPPGDI
ncbi:hypothetical protein DPEC_G00287560 [Dallia pectoralis]|uniref:Uncharacterized protein n=1 Tax=Dallia pectoralis TaxID=75939 RepID=A0ACC2FK80_DALPE|nr:hypothetical protein DPEC_G00287560 [Dallia pectoralis]